MRAQTIQPAGAHAGRFGYNPAMNDVTKSPDEIGGTQEVVRTVLSIDLAGYGRTSSMLEDQIGVKGVELLNEQISHILAQGISTLEDRFRDKILVKNTGDGALVVVERSIQAHNIADAVQQAVHRHNKTRRGPDAKRWFRIGAATGEVSLSRIKAEGKMAGSVVARAVRLETACNEGGVVIDSATHGALPPGCQSDYGDRESIAGKPHEDKIPAFRWQVIPQPAPSNTTNSPPQNVAELEREIESLKARADLLSEQERETLVEAEAELARRALARINALLGKSDPSPDGTVQGLTDAAVSDAVAGPYLAREGMAMIAEGNIPGGLDLLENDAKTASQWRQLGQIAFRLDTHRALRAYEKAWALDGTDPWDAIYLGRLHQQAGDLSAAMAVYQQALDSPQEWPDRVRMVLAIDKGSVHSDQGDLTKALESFTAALEIARKLAAADPGNAAGQRDLSVSHDKIGDVHRAQGDLTKALESFTAGLEIRKKLVAADPGNMNWQRDLSVSHNKIGDVHRDQGDLPKALESFTAGLEIREKLAAADPGNMEWQRDLSVSHDRIGDVHRDQGDLSKALESFTNSHEIAEKLAAADPGNAAWKRDLSLSHQRIGDVYDDQGEITKAQESFAAALRIGQELVAADPGNAAWQRDIAISHDRLSLVFQAQENWTEAIRSMESALSIIRPLAEKWPDHPQFQKDLAEAEADLAALQNHAED